MGAEQEEDVVDKARHFLMFVWGAGFSRSGLRSLSLSECSVTRWLESGWRGLGWSICGLRLRILS